MTRSLPQADDFRLECEALAQVLANFCESDFDHLTQFKGWSINDILGHLLIWDFAAGLTLRDAEAFTQFAAPMPAYSAAGQLRVFERQWLGTLKGKALLERWQRSFAEIAAQFGEADPRKRLRWGGPELSARSCISSRLMEVWSHGQAIYDELGIQRVATDRLHNIAVLGIKTFAWTFRCRALPVPALMPQVILQAPSGTTWSWMQHTSEESVSGSAEEFCQVVTQVRNVGDTALRVTGPVAAQWMSVAQCFAGPAQAPPPVGSRHRRVIDALQPCTQGS